MNYIESPEFEFQLPKQEQNFLSADELICKGVVLPFNLLSLKPESESESESEVEPVPVPEAEIEVEIHLRKEAVSASKRWTNYILKLTDKKKEATPAKTKKERGSRNKAELNINIWPFSRSHSAGTADASSPNLLPVMRKSMSEPCSRSNSGRRWVASPGRAGGGVHLGRASPVWQGKRVGSKRAGKEKVKRSGLNLNVNSCISGDNIESDGNFIWFGSLFTAKKVC